MWTSIVTLMAAALSLEVKGLIKRLNETEAQKDMPADMKNSYLHHVEADVKKVLELHGCNHALTGGPVETVKSIVEKAQAGMHWGSPESLLALVKEIKSWRKEILTTFDGSGHLLTSRNLVMFSEERVPVRITVDGAFHADCLDSNDLLELFLCCEKDDALLQPGATISMVRYLAKPCSLCATLFQELSRLINYRSVPVACICITYTAFCTHNSYA